MYLKTDKNKKTESTKGEENNKKIELVEDGENSVVKYLHKFNNKNIKINKSILTFNRNSITNLDFSSNETTEPYEIDVLDGENFIDKIKIAKGETDCKLCIDITNALNKSIKENSEFLCITFCGVEFENCNSFEIKNLYSLTKQISNKSPHIKNNLKRVGNVQVNLATGEMNLVHNDIKYDGLIPINITNVYNSFNSSTDKDAVDAENGKINLPKSSAGRGWKLNLEQYLVKEKNNSDAINDNTSIKYTYIDGNGNHNLFNKKFYYETGNSSLPNKVYLKPNQVSILPDGKMTYTEGSSTYDVKIETETDCDYLLNSRLEGIEGVNLINQDIDELLEIKNQIQNLKQNRDNIISSLKLNRLASSVFSKSKNASNNQIKGQILNHLMQAKNLSFSKENKINEINYSKQYLKYLAESIYLYGKKVDDENHGVTETNLKNYQNSMNNNQILITEKTNEYKWGQDWEKEPNVKNSISIESEEDLITKLNSNSTDPVSLSEYEKKIILNNKYSLESNIEYSKEQEKYQDEQLNNEFKMLCDSLDNYNIQIKKLIYTYNDYKKQVPEQYISNKEKSIVLGFAKFKEESLAKCTLKNSDEIVNLINSAITNNQDLDIELNENIDYEIELDEDVYRLVVIFDNKENSILVKYNDSNIYDESRIESITSENNQILFDYNENGLLEKITDDKGNRIKYSYNISGFLTEINYEDDLKIFEYDTNNKLSKVTNSDGYYVKYNWQDTSKLQIFEGSGCSEISSNQYDTNHSGSSERMVMTIDFFNERMTKVTDRKGKVITYLFDNNGVYTTVFEGDIDEANPNQAGLNILEHICYDGECLYEMKKLPNAKNLLNVSAEAYSGDGSISGDDIYGSINSLDDNNIYTLVGADLEQSKKEFILGNTSIDLINNSSKTFVFSGFAKANAMYVSALKNGFGDELEEIISSNLDLAKIDRKFELRAEITYEDNTTEILRSYFDWTQPNWQYAELPIIIKSYKTLKSLKFYVDYSNNLGLAKIFGFTLTEAEIEETKFNKDKKAIAKSIFSKNIKEKFEYDNDNVIKKTISLGYEDFITRYFYNLQGVLLKTIDHNGIVKENCYDDKGKFIKTITYSREDPTSKFITETNYDEKGDMLGELNEFGEEQQDGVLYGYDLDNQTIKSIGAYADGEENGNYFKYNKGMLTTLIHNDFDINYTYDGFGELKKINIGNSDTDYLTINEDENRTLQTYASGEAIETIFDDKGNVLKVNFAKNNAENVTVLENTFDSKDNLVSQLENADTKKYRYDYTYDKYGNQTSMKKSEIVTEDDGENLKQEVLVESTFDKFGNVTKTTTTYLDDLATPISTINEGAELITRYKYSDDLDKKLIKVEYNNSYNTYNTGERYISFRQDIKYDPFGRLKELSIKHSYSEIINKSFGYLKKGEYASNRISSIWYGSKNGRDSLRYSYDEKGNISKIFENGVELARFTYDELSRIVREDNKKLDKTYFYEYDRGGNIVRKTSYKYNLNNRESITSTATTYNYEYSATGWKDQMLSFNGLKCEYDALGNPTKYKGNDLEWDNIRNLKSYHEEKTTTDTNKNKITNILDDKYTYDKNGIRTSKTVVKTTKNITAGTETSTTETKKYIVNGNRILMQDNGDAATNDGVSTKLFFNYGADGVIGFTYRKNKSSFQNYYYKKNVQGDIIGIYDQTGKEIVKYYYDAWGFPKAYYTIISWYEVKETDTYENALIAKLNPFRYRSYYYDEETKLYYLNSRYYDPETGRFINADDISYLDSENINGLNLYAYCGNSPVMYADLNGCFPILAFILGITALVGMGLTIGGVASDNNVITAIGLTMVAVPALISGIGALFSGATYLGIIGGATAIMGVGTSLFASAEYQEAFTGNNWMIDAGMSEEWYNGLMLTIAALATAGTIATGVLTSIGNAATPNQMMASFQKHPNRWKTLKELIESAKGKNKGGISTYSNYINKWTGSKLGIHKIIRFGRFIHGPHFHPWI